MSISIVVVRVNRMVGGCPLRKQNDLPFGEVVSARTREEAGALGDKYLGSRPDAHSRTIIADWSHAGNRGVTGRPGDQAVGS